MGIDTDQILASDAAPAPAEPRQSTPAPDVEIAHLTKVFGEKRALDDLTLDIARGEIFGLLGPNGSGKSTCINIISGLMAPTSGTVRVLGNDVRKHARSVRRSLGTVPQETALYEELTGRANLEFHADLFGVARQRKAARIEQILELVQLVDQQHARVRTYSGGMKRRLAIGRALLHDPQLLYLDEPSLGVDVQSRRAIWEYILTLREQSKTVLLTTNYLEEAQVLCDRLAIIDRGRLVAVDTPAHLCQTYGGKIITIQVGSRDQAESFDLDLLRGAPSVTRASQEGAVLSVTTQGTEHALAHIVNLITRSCDLVDIDVRESTLDEVFLRLTGTALRD